MDFESMDAGADTGELRMVDCVVETMSACAPGATVRQAGRPLAPADADSRRAPGKIVAPDYLIRHYGWAYLNRFAVWLFDHQAIINAILLGQYQRVVDRTLRLVEPESAGRTVQLAAVYGKLTPVLAARIADFHLVDVAPIQLDAVRRKLDAAGLDCRMRVMNVERLDYRDSSFDTALMFLLLHELPPEARRNALREAIRVLKPGGKLVIAEYGAMEGRHWIHRLGPARWIFEKAEPFLGGFWRENLAGTVRACAAAVGRRAVQDASETVFGGFYRVARFAVT